ncbi:MAG TPA: hypothetical protein VF432_19515 [Thermoanaerobaculia bacterium]
MRRLSLLVIAVCLSCKPAPQPAKPAAAGPQVRATVVTIRTTVDKKTHDHAIVIAGDRARSTSEHDTWRLFDTKAKTVTIVDDVERTVKTERLPDVLQRRNTVNAAVLPPHYPHAEFARTNERRAMQGVTAQKATIVSGGYTRELWLAEHPSIPADLFAMMHASEAPSSPLAPMMRDVDRELVAARGFPFLDRTTVPVGKGELVVERAVVGISQREVPESMLAIPKGYEDRTNGRTAGEGLAEGARRKN